MNISTQIKNGVCSVFVVLFGTIWKKQVFYRPKQENNKRRQILLALCALPDPQ
jgi:hypothetical protein